MVIVGQQQIRERMVHQINENRVPHAQLLCGPQGCGKMAVALSYAQALLCKERTEHGACGKCASCRMVEKFEHPDLHFVFPVIRPKGKSGDVVSDQYLPQWRKLLRETLYFDLFTWLLAMGVENQQAQIGVGESDKILQKLSLVSGQGGYKVMIIWLPELMNTSAANKLLKILEEPTPQTAFLLVSENPEQLLTTIVSRTQRLELKALQAEDIMQSMMDHHHLQIDDARRIARKSNGNYQQALNELRVNEESALFFDMFVQLMRLSYMRNIKDIYEWAEVVCRWGRERQKNFLDYCQYLLRENFIYNFKNNNLNYMSTTESDFSVKFARFINERNVIGIMDELSDAQRDIAQNVNARMVFIDFALKMIVLLKQ